MTNEWEQLLEEVALGDVASNDPRVQARAATDPGFARELEEVLGVQGALSAVGKSIQAGAKELPELADTLPDMDAARETLRTLSAETLRHARRRRMRWVATGLMTAAAVVLLIVRPFGAGSSEGGLEGLPDIALGGELSELSPGGAVEAIEVLSWSYAGTGTFKVEVRDAKTGDLIDSVHGLSETEWAPSAARPVRWPEGWPDEVQWIVTPSDHSGQQLPGKAQTVRRLSSRR